MMGACNGLCDGHDEYELTEQEKKEELKKNMKKYKVMRNGMKGYEVCIVSIHFNMINSGCLCVYSLCTKTIKTVLQ